MHIKHYEIRTLCIHSVLFTALCAISCRPNGRRWSACFVEGIASGKLKRQLLDKTTFKRHKKRRLKAEAQAIAAEVSLRHCMSVFGVPNRL